MKCVLCGNEVSNMDNMGVKNICSDCFLKFSDTQKKQCQIISQKNNGIINDVSLLNDYNVADVNPNKKGDNNKIYVAIVLIIFSLPIISIMRASKVEIIGWIIFLGILLFLYLGVVSNMEKDKENREKISENSSGIKKSLLNKNFNEDKNISYTQFNIIQNGQRQNIYIDLKFDTKNQQIAICKYNTNDFKILKFSDIIECEIIEDKESIMKGGIGRAVVGGVVAGGVGAIVGANTRSSKNIVRNLQIRIVTKNITDSMVTIDLVTQEIKTDSIEYKNAIKFSNEVYSTIISIIHNQKENIINKASENINISQQIRELSKLKDDGIITEQEFNYKKQELLNKM